MRLSPRLHRSFIEIRPKSASRELINIPVLQSHREAPCTDYYYLRGVHSCLKSRIPHTFVDYE